ncbi:MAG: hypothetical protein K0Q48_2642 [Bacillota bacterium]|nr:hypothetical protein [Bacillota bacterium]
MINKILAGVSTAVLGVLIAAVPNFTPLQICELCQRMAMKCSWAAKAEFGVGVLILFLSILLIFSESKDVRLGVSAALGMVGILSTLIAKVLIGFCAGDCCSGCTCSPLTPPVMTGLGIAVAAIAFINVIYLLQKKNT